MKAYVIIEEWQTDGASDCTVKVFMDYQRAIKKFQELIELEKHGWVGKAFTPDCDLDNEFDYSIDIQPTLNKEYPLHLYLAPKWDWHTFYNLKLEIAEMEKEQ